MNKQIKLTLSILFIFSLKLIFSTSIVYAGCAEGECSTKGMYECQGGNMCCTGGGCPSWACIGGGGLWQSGNPPLCRLAKTCQVCVTEQKCTTEWRKTGQRCYTAPACPAFQNSSPTLSGLLHVLNSVSASSISEDILAARCCVDTYSNVQVCQDVLKCSWVTDGNTCGWNVYAAIANGGTCEWCSGTPPTEPPPGGGGPIITPPPPSCTVTDFIGTSLVANPLNPSTFTTNETITFTWGDPRTCDPRRPTSCVTDWGVCCGTCTPNFEVYVDGVKQFGLAQGINSRSIAAHRFSIGTHSWYVVATNGAAGTVQSAPQNFTVTSSTVSVEGYIWDSTGASCTLADKSSAEIQPSSISGSITPTVDSTSGTWDTNQSGKSYTVSNITQGNNKVLCASVPNPVGKPGFRYSLSCLNGASTGIFSGSCAYINATSNPTRADLGYKLTSSGWYQVLGGGDVYAGCSSCIDSISLGIPALSDILGGFSDAFIDDGGSLFANSDVSIKSPSGSDKITSASSNHYYNKFMSDGAFWPNSFSFNPPTSAQEINSNCSTVFTNGSLNPNNVYKMSANCFQSGIDNVSSSYSTSGDGVVVIYVTGGNTISFTRNFKSESSNKRIMVVTESNIEVGSSVGEIAPTKSTAPNIQASLISRQSIRLLSNGTSTDTSLVIEGPIATKDGNISFDRDRGLQNAYPAQVVVYNPIYLTAPILTTSTGVSVVDISWTLTN